MMKVSPEQRGRKRFRLTSQRAFAVLLLVTAAAIVLRNGVSSPPSVMTQTGMPASRKERPRVVRDETKSVSETETKRSNEESLKAKTKTEEAKPKPETKTKERPQIVRDDTKPASETATKMTKEESLKAKTKAKDSKPKAPQAKTKKVVVSYSKPKTKVKESRTKTRDPSLDATKFKSKKPKAGPLFHLVFSTGDETVSTLNMRCMESIFYFHPDARLHIHTKKDTGLSGKKTPKLKPLLEKGYDITFVHYNPEDVLQAAMDVSGSEVDKKAAKKFISELDKLSKEKYWYSNETNLLRMCLLYLQGGIYLDTDVILINPVLASDDRIDNAMAQNGRKFHCAVMKFTKPGNRFLAACINNFLHNYDGLAWGNNGPKAFGRTAAEHPELVCPYDDYDYVNNVTGSTKSEKTADQSCWLKPLPGETFAPVSWKLWNQVCFSKDSPIKEKAKEPIRKSLAVHLNNRKEGQKLEAKEYTKGSLCDWVLSAFCILCK